MRGVVGHDCNVEIALNNEIADVLALSLATRIAGSAPLRPQIEPKYEHTKG